MLRIAGEKLDARSSRAIVKAFFPPAHPITVDMGSRAKKFTPFFVFMNIVLCGKM